MSGFNDDPLIDFNSPEKKTTLLAPLVPLPKCFGQSIQCNSAISVSDFGDNPFDNVVVQAFSQNDPFELVHTEALISAQKDNEARNKTSRESLKAHENNDIEARNKTSRESLKPHEKNDNEARNKTSRESLKAHEKNDNEVPTISSKTQNTDSQPVTDIDADHKSKNGNTSIEIMYPKSEVKLLNENMQLDKFNQLYISAQQEKDILDESSMCIVDEAAQNVSLASHSLTEEDIIPLTRKCSNEEVKQFVANRIENCIKKALNDSRRNLSFSTRRRSLSASVLCPASSVNVNHDSSAFYLTSDYTSPVSRRNFARSRPSTSFQDLRVPSISPRRSYGDTGSTCSSSILNRGFRKSTDTSPVSGNFSSFSKISRRCFSSDNLYKRASSPVQKTSFLCSSLEIENDSVFVNEKNFNSVLGEAKNLSLLFQQSAGIQDTQKNIGFEDDNFLTRDEPEVALVTSDSESSFSENDFNERKKQYTASVKTTVSIDEQLIIEKNLPRSRSSSSLELVSNLAKEGSLPALSRKTIKGLTLETRNGLGRVPSSIVPLPSLPLPDCNSTSSLKIKPKSQINGPVVVKGPLKAMIPVGNMMRQDSTTKHTSPKNQSLHRGLSMPKIGICSTPNKSTCEVSTPSFSNRFPNAKLPDGKVLSPILGACQQNEFNWSTGFNTTPSLVSPAVSLRVPQSKVNHSRSKSVDQPINPSFKKPTVSKITPKPGLRIRLESDLIQKKLPTMRKSTSSSALPNVKSSNLSPLRSLAKNRTSVTSRTAVAKPTKKILPKKGTAGSEKENMRPTRKFAAV